MSEKHARHAGRVALITGGASGIGKATVVRLLEEGVFVVFADINLETGSRTLRATQDAGYTDHVRFFPCDVMQEADMEHAVRFTRETFGRLDYLVNNAGTGGVLRSLLDTTAADWDKTQSLISRSAFLGIKFAAQAMIERGEGGAIVTVASIAGHTGGAAGAAYSAAKAATLNLAATAAEQLGKHRIRVNTVSPGTIITPLLIRGEDEQRFRDAAAVSQPWPEPGEPEHVASAIAFLLSDDARFVTGTDLMVDGGATAQGVALYGGNHPLGNAISDAIQKSQAAGFDKGSTVSSGRRLPWDQQVANIDMLTPSTRDEKRTVLITGVSRGLGLALAEQLIVMGHTVIGCARSAEAVNALQSHYGSPHRFALVDVADDEAVKRWIDDLDVADVFPDLIVNNAAITNSPRQLWRFDAAEIENVLRVNVLGTMNVLRHTLPKLLKRRRGIVINFSSGWGREAAARVGPYCASKWAIEGLTRSLAEELPPQIGVVSLHPGIIRTETMAASFGEAAARYPTPTHWAKVAAPFLLSVTSEDNGRAIAVPGMTNFYGMGRV